MNAEKCANNTLEIAVKTKRRVRFKAGSDLSSKVNRVAIEVIEEASDDHEMIELKIQLFGEDCLKTDC